MMTGWDERTMTLARKEEEEGAALDEAAVAVR
jgi:hypothetical protein